MKFLNFQLVFELVNSIEVRAPKSSDCLNVNLLDPPLRAMHDLLQITLLAWRIVSLENNACRSLLLFLASCSDH